MECEGLVTKVDPYYGYFEVNNKSRVHLSLIKCSNKNTKLPVLESRISATHLHKSSSTYIACETTILKGNFTYEFEQNSFTHLLKKYSLGSADLIMVDKTLDMLDKNFKFESDMKEKIIVSLIENLATSKGEKCLDNKHICLNSVLAHLDVMSISSCRNIKPVSTKFEQFPPWSFGVHRKPHKHSVLFGFLYIHPKYNRPYFKDSFYKAICIITGTSHINIPNNSYIILSDYLIITEIFKDRKVTNLEYLIVSIKDITVLHSLENSTPLLAAHPPVEDFNKYLNFILLMKSTICIGSNSNQEAYLEVSIKNKNVDSPDFQKIFLILNSDYIPLVMHLKEGFEYKLCHNLCLNKVTRSELKAIETLENFELVESKAYFQELQKVEHPKILTVEECLENISKITQLFSFEGIVRNRKFCKSFYQPKLRTNLDGFSTPGSETHTVVFTCDKYHDKSLVLYLSNWVNRLMPVGLVPQMRVIVKNVKAKPTYVQSTIFTSIEIVSYEPLIQFWTANLYTNHEHDWGIPFYLSLGNQIPHGVIVWSKIQNIHILDVKMINRCKNCEVVKEAPGPCIHCRGEETTMDFKLILYASDGFGTSKVIVKNINFLRLVLDLTDARFSTWLQGFQSIGEYNFNIQDNGDSSIDMEIVSEPNFFKHIFTQLIIQFNSIVTDMFEMKCRKQFITPRNCNKYEPPQWFYLDARKVIT